MHLSFQNTFYILGSLIGLFAIMILAKSVLIPIAFALLIAFILFPVNKKFESWGINELMSAFLSLLTLILPIAAGVFLFSNQIIQLSDNINDFKAQITNVFEEVTTFIDKKLGFLTEKESGDLYDTLLDLSSSSAGSVVSESVSGTADFFFGFSTTIVFTFLILIYRKRLVKAFVSFYPEQEREQAFKMFKKVQHVGQQYLFGMMGIILILGFMNSIGLWVIGIDNPFLFGFLAAALALIPYVGTFIGAAIPILYSFISEGALWMPITIAIFFWFVQFIESNFLTPKIVGGNLNINIFASILSIIIGASVWGVSGMILFLPFTAILKVVCNEYEALKPIATLIGEERTRSNNMGDRFLGRWFKKLKAKF